MTLQLRRLKGNDTHLINRVSPYNLPLFDPIEWRCAGTRNYLVDGSWIAQGRTLINDHRGNDQAPLRGCRGRWMSAHQAEHAGS